MKVRLDLNQTQRLTLFTTRHRYVFLNIFLKNLAVLLDYLFFIRHRSACICPLISAPCTIFLHFGHTSFVLQHDLCAPELLFKFWDRRCQLFLLSCCSSLGVLFIIEDLALDCSVTFQVFRLEQPRAISIDDPARIGFAI